MLPDFQKLIQLEANNFNILLILIKRVTLFLMQLKMEISMKLKNIKIYPIIINLIIFFKAQVFTSSLPCIQS